MKKQTLLLCAIFIDLIIYAQPRLTGMLLADGPNYAGTIIQYTGGDTTISALAALSPQARSPINSTLTLAANNKFYGLITQGGNRGKSTIIEYDHTTNSYTIMVKLDSATGNTANGHLLLANDGKFYATTADSGAYGGGTLFSYTAGANFVTKLRDFSVRDGTLCSLIQASDDNLYGITADDGINNGGKIFRYNIAADSFNSFYSLPAGVTSGIDLYEAGPDTLYGIGSNGPFRYVLTADSGIYSAIPGFNVGFSPSGAPILASNGLLYGLTFWGGSYSSGSLYSYNLGTEVFDTLHNFGAGTDGTQPYGDLYQASDGMLYGMTSQGGTSGVGTIFRYDITTATYTLLVNLNSATGNSPYAGHLTEYTGPLGMANISPYSFSLFPNPTSGLFTLENNYSSKLSVYIINVLGERLKEFTLTGTQQAFNISDLSSGIYVVQISNNTQMLKTMKIVKE